MKRVYKYQFTERRAIFALHLGAQFRALLIQDSLPTVWFEVEDERPTEKRSFEIFTTGASLPEGVLWYVGTYQFTDPEIFVGHVYEIRDGAKPKGAK